jgi:hypothetical protein
MRISTVGYTLSVSAVVVLLAGCGGPQPPIGASGTTPQSPAIATHAERGGSWMLPEAKSKELLYVSNVQTVAVFTYPKGKLVGQIKGFYLAAGECTDESGDVYIANLDTFTEYRHGGKKPIKTLSMHGYSAVDCSVNQKNGALATTWNQSASSTNYIAVYENATGTPTLYGVSGDFIFYCGYDSGGNLLADGQVGNASQQAVFVELPSGASELKNITINENFQHVGAVQWDGKYWAIGDDVLNKIYRVTIVGSNGTVHSTVDLDNAQGMYQWWIDGKRVIGPQGDANAVYYWHYPEGGSPIKSITKDIQAPYGVTVSVAPGT